MDEIKAIENAIDALEQDCDELEAENEELKQALRDIIQHTEFVAGPKMAQLSGVWRIARKALERCDGATED